MTSTLTIDRFTLSGTAPASADTPDRLRAIWDRIDRQCLCAAATRAFAGFDTDDRRVFVLRRLEVVIEGVKADPEHLAYLLAQGMARLVARMADGSRSDRLVIFASPEARLAAFLDALLRGEAFDRWWFADFDGLRPLPRSSAIRAALVRDPAVGLAALGLSAANRRRLIHMMSEVDARLCLDAMLETLDEDGEEAAMWEAVFMAPGWEQSTPAPHEDLVLLGQVTARLGVPPGRCMAVALRLRHAVSGVNRQTLADIISARAAPRLRQLAPSARTGDIARLLALPDSVRTHIAAALRQGAPAQDTPPVARHTPFGGLLLLWPHVPVPPALLTHDDSGEDVGRWILLVLSAIRGAQAQWPLADPLLRMALGVDPRISSNDLAEWLGTTDISGLPREYIGRRLPGLALPAPFRAHRRQYRAILAATRIAIADFVRRLPGFGGSSLPFLRTNLFDCGATIMIHPESVDVVLERPPLDVLLGISGLADRECPLPDGRLLRLGRMR